MQSGEGSFQCLVAAKGDPNDVMRMSLHALEADSHRHARHDDKTVLSVSRPFRRVNWIPDNSRLSPTEDLKSEHVQSNCPIHTVMPDTTQTGLFCRV